MKLFQNTIARATHLGRGRKHGGVSAYRQQGSGNNGGRLHDDDDPLSRRCTGRKAN